MTDIRDLKWLVEHRSKIQSLLLELYVFADKDRRTLDDAQSAAFQLLVGAGFSLWRAVFLADSARQLCTVDDDAREFLRLLVKDNAINYSQEDRTRAWTVGYYLNNAYFRLQLAYAKLPLDTPLKAAVDTFLRKQAESDLLEAEPTQPWETAYDAACEILSKVSGD